MRQFSWTHSDEELQDPDRLADRSDRLASTPDPEQSTPPKPGAARDGTVLSRGSSLPAGAVPRRTNLTQTPAFHRAPQSASEASASTSQRQRQHQHQRQSQHQHQRARLFTT